MFKLVLEKAEELGIKLLTSAGSQTKKGNSKKNFCFTDYAKAFDCVDYNKLGNSSRDGTIRSPASWEICMQVRKQQIEPDMEQWTSSKLESMSRLYVGTLLI